MTSSPVSETRLPPLPIDGARERILAALEAGPLVIASPTGSGKSTRVPRFCPGTVLVVEPRRVACMTLAERVAEEAGSPLGEAVGYWVRDDRRMGDDTRVLFATPGVVLRARHLLDRDVVILDEFHERGLETDLLFALLVARRHPGLIVMSATLETQRVKAAVGGELVEVDGRLHPVEVRHSPGGVLLPDGRDLEQRVAQAVKQSAALPGDVLVFLPGKGEIARAADALSSLAELELVELHGGLSLEAQRRAFAPSRRRKVVLATNVAETSVTVPGIGVVIDSGLVRRTRYHYGRSYLTLTPIARDSAEQRAGRAGRTGPGVCIRLWDRAAVLEATTPPEVHREALGPLLLATAAAGARVEDLPFLDAPKAHALEDARTELRALGALKPEDGISTLGEELFGLPIDPGLGRLLVEARERGTLQDAIDLVAALGTGRPLFLRAPNPEARVGDDLREVGCDACAAITALRRGEPRKHGLGGVVLSEARRTAKRLREAFGVERADADATVDRRALAATVLAADSRSAHVARERKRRVAFSNGGTELELARESALHLGKLPEAIAVLGVRAITDARGQRHLLCTAAMPLSPSQLVEAELGRERVGAAGLERGVALATVERVYAKRVLASEQRVPEGRLARETIATLFQQGRLLKGALVETRLRLEARTLAREVARRGRLGMPVDALPPAIELEAWTLERLEALGVESGEDAKLLSEADLTIEPLPPDAQAALDERFPLRVDLGDASYRAEYDFKKSRVTLHLLKGTRQSPPPRGFLPRLGGLTVFAEAGGRLHLVK